MFFLVTRQKFMLNFIPSTKWWLANHFYKEVYLHSGWLMQWLKLENFLFRQPLVLPSAKQNYVVKSDYFSKTCGIGNRDNFFWFLTFYFHFISLFSAYGSLNPITILCSLVVLYIIIILARFRKVSHSSNPIVEIPENYPCDPYKWVFVSFLVLSSLYRVKLFHCVHASNYKFDFIKTLCYALVKVNWKIVYSLVSNHYIFNNIHFYVFIDKPIDYRLTYSQEQFLNHYSQ